MKDTAPAAPTTGASAMWPSAKEQRDDGLKSFDACHRRILAVAAALEALAASLDRDEEPSPATRATAAAIAEFFSGDARAHHEHEERHVFPALMRNAEAAMVLTIRKLNADHDLMEETWMELEPHLQAIATGYGGWSKDVLVEGAALLVPLCRRHIEMEEALVYPQVRARLGRAGRRALGHELTASTRSA